jgi:hypothetical protein
LLASEPSQPLAARATIALTMSADLNMAAMLRISGRARHGDVPDIEPTLPGISLERD